MRLAGVRLLVDRREAHEPHEPGRLSAQEASLYAKPNDSVDLAEKIVELLDDPGRRERMGKFGRERVVNELAWRHEVPKLLAAYEKLWG